MRQPLGICWTIGFRTTPVPPQPRPTDTKIFGYSSSLYKMAQYLHLSHECLPWTSPSFLSFLIWLHQAFAAAHRRFLAHAEYSAAAHGLPSCGSQAVQLCHLGSKARGLQQLRQRRLTCSVACGISVSQLVIKPMSPALQAEFLTAGLPGKSRGCPPIDFRSSLS